MNDPETKADEIAEQAAETLAAPLAAAVEAQAQAEQTAEQIAAAAMEGERGHRIETLERELEKCQMTISQLPELMAAKMLEQMQLLKLEISQETSNQVNSLLSAAIASVAAPAAPAPNPPLNASTPPQSVEPDQVKDQKPEAENETAAPVRKKRHRFL